MGKGDGWEWIRSRWAPPAVICLKKQAFVFKSLPILIYKLDPLVLFLQLVLCYVCTTCMQKVL